MAPTHAPNKPAQGIYGMTYMDTVRPPIASMLSEGDVGGSGGGKSGLVGEVFDEG